MVKDKIKEIPLPIIVSAMQGNEEAIKTVVNHYKSYIRCLSTRVFKDENNNEHMYIDEDKRTRLEVKLICSIINDYKILPA